MSLRGLGAQACNTIICCGARLLIRSSSVPSYRQPMHVSISFSLSSVPLQPHQPTFFVVLPLPYSFRTGSHYFMGGFFSYSSLQYICYHLTLSSCYELTDFKMVCKCFKMKYVICQILHIPNTIKSRVKPNLHVSVHVCSSLQIKCSHPYTEKEKPQFSSACYELYRHQPHCSSTQHTLWALQTPHCQSSSGTSSIGGSTHSRWNTAGQVSQHSKSPKR